MLGACRGKAPSPPYQLVPVVRRDIHVATSASGFIQPDTIVAVRSLTSGEVVALLADEGQLVHEGMVIAQIDRRIPKSALAEAQAAADVAKQQLEQAELSLRRSEQLLATRAITPAERDSVALTVASAKAAAIEADLNLANAKIALDNTDVRAPISGTVLSRSVERGQIVSSPSGDVGGGTLMFQIADLTHLQARTQVDETDIGRVKPGILTSITVPAYPGRSFDGHVLKLEPLADTVNSVTMYPVLVRVEDPNHLLISGMRADVQFDLAERSNAVAVPNAALDFAKDLEPRADRDSATTTTVFVQRPGGPTPVSIRTGVTNFDVTEVLAGLSAGDSVLVPTPALDSATRATLGRRLAQRTR
jgi:HlyD family secretion protein